MRILTTIILLFYWFQIFAQTANSKPSVYLDCQTNCHFTYLRQEVDFINYARDRQGADIYVLVTNQRASAGSQEIQMIFIYQSIDYLKSDTIKYYREANISDLDEMQLFKKNFKKGLLPVLIQDNMVDYISYTVELDSTSIFETETIDPWNYWSFNIGLNMNIRGEESFQEQEYFGRVSASRVTKKEKVFLLVWANLEESSFTLSDGNEVTSDNKRYRAFGQWVGSISDHWSAGVRALVGSSSFGNTDFEATVRPAIEFNVYPYSQNSTRRFSFMYTAGIVYNNYTLPTLFDQLEETLLRHGLDIEFEQTQPWGAIEFDIEFDQYLHDLSLYSISFNPNIELNLFKGLKLEFGGFISFVGDRINISKEDISDQDIILQNKQLDTSYSYASYVGFNYRFGSKNNNIVNPRF